MNGDAYASYRAAMPPECFGEPDDEPEGKPDWPVGYAVEWFDDVAFEDAETREMMTFRAPCGRWFPVLTTNGNAYRAAKRYAAVMARRHGCAAVTEEMFRGPSWSETVKPGPPEPSPF